MESSPEKESVESEGESDEVADSLLIRGLKLIWMSALRTAEIRTTRPSPVAASSSDLRRLTTANHRPNTYIYSLDHLRQLCFSALIFVDFREHIGVGLLGLSWVVVLSSRSGSSEVLRLVVSKNHGSIPWALLLSCFLEPCYTIVEPSRVSECSSS
ncbi:hypothetical protein L6452_02079 [Arctium lappa]|uniref:Uncharacterized protein n=1 Tax=Arctium lappa TaxID=4217 RepID=A0ACB9FIU9_ARCLA|nr:hypothetical protein L6452_02079 [Arctium lappa]